MRVRLFTIVLGLPFFLLPLVVGGWWWRGMMLASGAGMGWELGQLIAWRERQLATGRPLFGTEGGRRARPLPPLDFVAGIQGALSVLALMAATLQFGWPGLAGGSLVWVILVGLAELRPGSVQPLTRGGAWSWGVLYIGGLWGLATGFRLEAGLAWTLWPIVSVWASDVCAYLIGRRWGRHRLAPAISPGKSWEGLTAGLSAATGLGGLWAVYGIGTSGLVALAGSLLWGVAGVLGDLLESGMKREAGVKDAAAVLPGHGGLLDRFDSLLTAVALAALLHPYFRF